MYVTCTILISTRYLCVVPVYTHMSCTNRQTISGERVCEGEDTDTAPKKKLLDHPTILAVVVSLERILPERYVARGTQHSLSISTSTHLMSGQSHF